MTTVTIEKNNIHFKGHAGYGESGSDIVCSAISNLSRTLVSFHDEYTIVNNGKDVEISVFRVHNEYLYFVLRALLILEDEFPDYVKVVIV